MSPANYGEAIWNKLIYPSSNIEMVICGHYALIGGYEMNVGQRVDENAWEEGVSNDVQCPNLGRRVAWQRR